MNFRLSYHVLLLLMVLLLAAQPAAAIFHNSKTTIYPPQQNPTASLPGEKMQATGLSLPDFFQDRKRKRRDTNPYHRLNSTAEGTFSFICSIAALVSFAALGITGVSFFIIPVFVFATIATVYGAIGINRHKRGYAIAGLMLGLLTIVGGFIALTHL